MSASLLTIFATPKKFEGHIAIIQRNAIESWTRMKPRPEILLFGNDAGTAAIAAELGLRHIPHVKTNEWGTPLVSDLFEQAETLGQTPVLSYVNSDIILFDDFANAVSQVAAGSEKFLMVGRRTDIDITEPINFNSNWTQVRERARSEGVLQIARSIDYFTFSRGLYPSLPPLAIGRFWWDNWLLWKARAVGATVVDASRSVLILHQNHDYRHTGYGRGKLDLMASEESIRNARMTCEADPRDYDEGFFWRYAYTIDDATHKLTSSGIRSNPRRLWKQFKRYSSRPLGMMKLARRALTESSGTDEQRKAVAGSQAK
jgi:hypothetical protein